MGVWGFRVWGVCPLGSFGFGFCVGVSGLEVACQGAGVVQDVSVFGRCRVQSTEPFRP